MALTNIFDTFEELKSEALRLEILKQHAVDIVDVLDEEGKKRKNTADKGILSGKSCICVAYISRLVGSACFV